MSSYWNRNHNQTHNSIHTRTILANNLGRKRKREIKLLPIRSPTKMTGEIQFLWHQMHFVDLSFVATFVGNTICMSLLNWKYYNVLRHKWCNIMPGGRERNMERWRVLNDFVAAKSLSRKRRMKRVSMALGVWLVILEWTFASFCSGHSFSSILFLAILLYLTLL